MQVDSGCRPETVRPAQRDDPLTTRATGDGEADVSGRLVRRLSETIVQPTGLSPPRCRLQNGYPYIGPDQRDYRPANYFLPVIVGGSANDHWQAQQVSLSTSLWRGWVAKVVAIHEHMFDEPDPSR